MSTLYPQYYGSIPVERDLYVRQSPVHDLYANFKNGSLPELQNYVFSAIGGNRVTYKEVESLRKEIVSAAVAAGFPDDKSDIHGFDSACAQILHKRMGISPHEASRPGVWQFLTYELMPDIVRWRFPGQENITKQERFKAGVRNTFERLWWRGYLFSNVAGFEGEYALLKFLGEDELVQIMERPVIKADRPLAQKAGALLVSHGKANPKVPRSHLMREVQKRIIRLLPLISFDTLDDEQLTELLNGLFVKSIVALRKETAAGGKQYIETDQSSFTSKVKKFLTK